MNLKIKALLAFFILTLALLAAGCPERISIGKIEANPSKYANKDVVVAGRVTNSYGAAFLGGIYKIDDGTGSLWVLTRKGVPSKGAEVGAKGKIQETVNFGGKNYGFGLIEDDRKVK